MTVRIISGATQLCLQLAYARLLIQPTMSPSTRSPPPSGSASSTCHLRTSVGGNLAADQHSRIDNDVLVITACGIVKGARAGRVRHDVVRAVQHQQRHVDLHR